MLIDTHLHLSKDDYEDIDLIIKRALDNNVKYLIVSGCDKKGIIEALELIEKYDNIYITIGFHPSECNDITMDDIKWLEDLVINNPKVIGIGEIGLDYHYGKEDMERQLWLFKTQLDLALKHNKRVVIHTRDAIGATYDILKDYKLRGIIHCYSGSLEMANKFIKLGYLLGLGGVVTFSNSNLKEVVKTLDMTNFTLETDSPYLAPVPYRGQKNEPKYILDIAKFIAKIKNMSYEEVALITTNNVIKLFDLGI